MSLRSLFLAATLAAAGAAGAQPVELAGARFEPSATLGGRSLVLNGAGLRHKLMFKVYAAGLYLPAKAATPEAVYAANGPRRLHVVMLRDINANELGKLFTDGMQKNTTREEFAKVIPGTLRLADIFAARKNLGPGESFDVDYVPGIGTTILVNGKAAGEAIKEPEFFNSLMKIWLGRNPADDRLKELLLGQAPKAAPRAAEP